VLVGEVPKRYFLHKKLLCYYSTFFDAAFNGAFQESISGELKLPEEEARVFDVFVHWLYRGSLPLCWYGMSCATPSDCVSVYAMGEKWFIPRLQNDVCDRVRFWFVADELPSSQFFNLLYEATSPGCKLRQFFVKLFIYIALRKIKPDVVNSILEQNGDLAIDVAKETFLKLSVKVGPQSGFRSPERLPACEFHVHGSKTICYTCS